jgi:methionyl aminopeptidase
VREGVTTARSMIWPASSCSITARCRPASSIAAIATRLHLAQSRRLPRHPGRSRAADGDIVNIDVTVIVDGWHGDTSRMYGVGERAAQSAAPDGRHLRSADARLRGDQARRDAGRSRPRDPSLRRSERCSIVREFCGHGLGRVFHDAPNILHFGKPGQGEVRPA